jgi:hypothetical protein
MGYSSSISDYNSYGRFNSELRQYKLYFQNDYSEHKRCQLRERLSQAWKKIEHMKNTNVVLNPRNNVPAMFGGFDKAKNTVSESTKFQNELLKWRIRMGQNSSSSATTEHFQRARTSDKYHDYDRVCTLAEAYFNSV